MQGHPDDYWYEMSTRFLQLKERVRHCNMMVVGAYAKSHERYKRLSVIEFLWSNRLASDLDDIVCSYYPMNITALQKYPHRKLTQLFYTPEPGVQDYPHPTSHRRPYPNCLIQQDEQMMRQTIMDALAFLDNIENDLFLRSKLVLHHNNKLRAKLEQEVM